MAGMPVITVRAETRQAQRAINQVIRGFKKITRAANETADAIERLGKLSGGIKMEETDRK